VNWNGGQHCSVSEVAPTLELLADVCQTLAPRAAALGLIGEAESLVLPAPLIVSS
jgi:hypothetical protein